MSIAAIRSFKYLIETLKGKIQPNKVSYLLWALAPLIAFAAEIKQGVGILSLMTFIVGFNPLVIFLASFVNKKAAWKLTTFDLICGAFKNLSGAKIFFLCNDSFVRRLPLYADAIMGSGSSPPPQ